VGREDHLRGHTAQRFPDVDALGRHALAHELERREGAVPFVEMYDTRRNPHRAKRSYAAHAEQQFLSNANTLIAAVQQRGQFPILRLVAIDV
jgi:hypothetical protein